MIAAAILCLVIPLVSTLVAGLVGRKALFIVFIALALPIGYLLLDFLRHGGLKSWFATVTLWPAVGGLALGTGVAISCILDRESKDRFERSKAARSSPESLETSPPDPRLDHDNVEW